MRRYFAGFAAALAAAFVAFASTAPAHAELAITVDKTTQRMLVEKDGAELYVWPVSTGAPGYDTPSGTFTPFRMEKDHFSKEWDDAPMPNSIFFTMQGHAIHGSNHKSIGRPASHGCVRLEPKNAAILFKLVKQEGMSKTRVVLTGETPGSNAAPLVARQNNYQNNYRVNSRDGMIENGQIYGADGDIVATIPQRRVIVRGWRENNDGPRYYYYRERPDYAPPPRDNGPLGFLFGR